MRGVMHNYWLRVKLKLIQMSAIYCLILISDSIMVPCNERITLNTKGCANLFFFCQEEFQKNIF